MLLSELLRLTPLCLLISIGIQGSTGSAMSVRRRSIRRRPKLSVHTASILGRLAAPQSTPSEFSPVMALRSEGSIEDYS